jgi:NADP+-dependent farnesol dehydrogenase
MNYRALQREFVQEASSKLHDLTGELHPVHCDVTKEQDILAAFSWIKEHLGGIDIMINNAGVAHQSFLAGKLLIIC